MREVALVFLGVLIGLIPPWYARKRRLKNHWWALRAEMRQCREKAQTLLNDQFSAPLYRFPTMAFHVSLPILLADGALTEPECLALGRFFAQAQDINRGLDNAAEMYKNNDENKLKAEHNRNCLKATHLLQSDNGNPSLYAAASAVVDRKISLPWWKPSKNA
jgi:hypothetical protein